MPQTQKQRLLEKLKSGTWVCTNAFYRDYMSDPRTILSQLRKEKNLNNQPAYNLEWRWCQDPAHNHLGNSKEWRLL